MKTNDPAKKNAREQHAEQEYRHIIELAGRETTPENLRIAMLAAVTSLIKAYREDIVVDFMDIQKLGMAHQRAIDTADEPERQAVDKKRKATASSAGHKSYDSMQGCHLTIANLIHKKRLDNIKDRNNDDPLRACHDLYQEGPLEIMRTFRGRKNSRYCIKTLFRIYSKYKWRFDSCRRKIAGMPGRLHR